MKPTPEAQLLVAKAMLAAFEREGGPHEAMTFWKEAVADCEAETVRHKPVEKPE
jgi:hypothetical protein